jgi:Immunity protein 35
VHGVEIGRPADERSPGLSRIYGCQVIDEETARRSVEEVIARWPQRSEPDEEFIVWRVEEHSRVWVFHFATRRWVRTRDFRDQAVGSCPFLVEKATGEVHLYGSGEYPKFVAWLDEGSRPRVD